MLDMFLQTLEPHQYFDEEDEAKKSKTTKASETEKKAPKTAATSTTPAQNTAQIESAVER